MGINEAPLESGSHTSSPRAAVEIHSDAFKGGETYRVWACDNQVYGPIPFSILSEWVQDRRVLPETWLYLESVRSWQQAAMVAELKNVFPASEDTIFLQNECLEQNGVDPQELRLFPVLACLSNHDLAHFIRLAELVTVRRGEFVIQRREPGDSVFFVLSGRLRAQITVGHDEKVLSHILPGQFLGEMAMFTQTPRTADVIAEDETRLLRFTAESFRTLIIENPAAAAPMLYAMSATMAQRMLATNNKFQAEVAGGFVWR